MSKIKLGDTYTEKVRYTQANVDTFAQISGDNNPIHINPEYASKSIFGRCIVHGFFAGAVFSKVFGTQWPGEGTMSPVFVEQDYNAVFEVVELDEVKHRGTIKCTLQDADGKVAIAGTAKLLNAERF